MKNTDLNKTNGAATTVSDTATLLRGLYDSTMFDSASREFVLKSLKEQTWRKGIPAGCVDCVTYNKIGDLGYVRHDAGIIKSADKSYLLVVFTNGASYSQIAELTAQVNSLVVTF